MIFNSKATPRWLSTVAGLIGAVSLAALLASCGGGTSQYSTFTPQRLLVFGDENSVINANGSKYTVNGLSNGAIDCTANPIWVQSLASYYGFTFAECNPNAVGTPQARMLAQPGAKVDDVAGQVAAQVAAGGFRDKDMATVMAGGNDMLELYALYPSRSEDSLLAESRARGRRLAAAVNRLVDLGAKVIVADLPDMGQTPFANAQNLQGLNSTLLSRLTAAFNEQLGANVLLDGRFVGLVQAQLQFQAMSISPSSFGLSNVREALCTVALPDCTTNTVVSGGNIASYLWAADIQYGPVGHNQLAQLAEARARGNPF